MVDLEIQEITDDVRRDQFQAFLKRYGNVMIGTVIAVLIGVGGYQFYQSHKEQQLADAANLFFQADELQLGDKNLEEADKLFKELSKDYGKHGFAALAALRSATIALDEGKTDEAIAEYENLGHSKADAS